MPYSLSSLSARGRSSTRRRFDENGGGDGDTGGTGIDISLGGSVRGDRVTEDQLGRGASVKAHRFSTLAMVSVPEIALHEIRYILIGHLHGDPQQHMARMGRRS